MRYRSITLALCLLDGTIACTGQSAKAPEATSAKVAQDYPPNSAEADCLAQANAERTLPKDPPSSIDAAHILVRHAELDRPSGATRTRGEACLRALAALEALQGGADWDAVVTEYSDSGKATAGELGTIRQDEVTPAFARAAFSLAPNELSYVVETDRGFHIILRR